MGPVAALLPDGHRLHLQHGPIDLIIGAVGERNAAFEAAKSRFASILDELVTELPYLRQRSSGNAAPFASLFSRDPVATRSVSSNDK